MTSFVNYLLESGISLSLFALAYFLFLRRETYFSVNRWFLLVSIGFSAFLPLLHIPFYAPQATVLQEVTVTPYINLLSTVTVYSTALSQGAEQFVLTYVLFGYLYLLIVAILSVKLFIQIYQIVRLIAQNQVIPEGKMRLVVLDKELSPFSFLNYIFVSKDLQKTEGWEKMLEHEKQHIRQGHTFDVLALEFIAVFQWFNPFFWMFKRALRENHEFLADQAVIAQGTAPSRYKQILINQYVGDQIILANNFNYSLIKIRIKMMSKIKSSKIANVKVLIGMVLAVGLIAVFACEQKQTVTTGNTTNGKTVTVDFQGKPLQVTGDSVIIENLKNLINKDGMGVPPPPPPAEVYMVVEQMPVFPGGDAEFSNFIIKSLKYPDEAIKKGIQGKVYVSFVVAPDSIVYDAKVVRSANPLLDAEAIRVISSMPKWTPGKQGGKVVPVQLTVPINFQLQ